MITEKLKLRLAELHGQENEMNAKLCIIDKYIAKLQKDKLKLQKRISGNMKFRNHLLDINTSPTDSGRFISFYYGMPEIISQGNTAEDAEELLKNYCAPGLKKIN